MLIAIKILLTCLFVWVSAQMGQDRTAWHEKKVLVFFQLLKVAAYAVGSMCLLTIIWSAWV